MRIKCKTLVRYKKNRINHAVGRNGSIQNVICSDKSGLREFKQFDAIE